MSDTSAAPSQEQLALLSQVVRSAARAGRLSHEDAQDFSQSVHVRLLERDYDIFWRFAGRSSLRTYLRVVANRMLLDWRNSMYGKWRPSATAVNLGHNAVTLERLISRDDYTLHEAIERVGAGVGAPSRQELTRLAGLLPARQKRRLVSEQALQHVDGIDFDDPIDAEERSREEHRTHAALMTALQQLSMNDRWLIHTRYQQRRSVQEVARSLQTDPKSLYRQFDRVLRSLRHALKAAGVESSNDSMPTRARKFASFMCAEQQEKPV